MALKPARGGLRVMNRTNHVAKIDLRVPEGEVLEVSEEVAAEFLKSPDFRLVEDAKTSAAPVEVEDVEPEAAPKRGRKRA